MFTNNKQKTKLSLELVRKWELFSAKKIVDKVSKLVLKYFHKYHLHFIQQRRIPAPSNREAATQSKKSRHITSSYKSEFSYRVQLNFPKSSLKFPKCRFFNFHLAFQILNNVTGKKPAKMLLSPLTFYLFYH